MLILKTIRAIEEGKLSINAAKKTIKKIKLEKKANNIKEIEKVEKPKTNNERELTFKISSEMDSALVNYMKDVKISDEGDAIRLLFSTGMNCHYYH